LPAGSPATVLTTFGAADAILALLIGSIAAWISAAGLGLAAGTLNVRSMLAASVLSGRAVIGALVVLYLAWSLGDLIQKSSAAEFLASTLSGRLPVALLPPAVFVLACVTSFATGTSWFTMAALVPLVIPLAITMGGDTMGVLVIASTAAVIDGAIFGDHASPLSDTTILSAIGAGCDLVLHVQTQLPYALVVATLAMLLVTSTGFGAPWWLLLPAGAIACVAIVRGFGRTSDG
jgi:Na+/H+ antiporter NhaC